MASVAVVDVTPGRARGTGIEGTCGLNRPIQFHGAEIGRFVPRPFAAVSVFLDVTRLLCLTVPLDVQTSRNARSSRFPAAVSYCLDLRRTFLSTPNLL